MNTLLINCQRVRFVCSLIGLAVIALSAPAYGQVYYFGCDGGDFGDGCSLADLQDPPINPGAPVFCPPLQNPTKKIVIGDTMLYRFWWQPGFQTGGAPLGASLSDIRVEGIDSKFYPELRFIANNNAWNRSVFTVSLNNLSFNVCRIGGPEFPLLDRQLFADFGLIRGHDTAEGEDSSVFIKDRMIVRLDSGNTTDNNEHGVQCFASEFDDGDPDNDPDVNPEQVAVCSDKTVQGAHENEFPPGVPFFFQNYNMTSVVEMNLIAEGAQLNGNAALNKLIYQLKVDSFAHLAAVPNIGGSAAPELGVALSGSLNAYIKDASSDELINQNDLTFNSARTPLDAGVADISGSPAFAVLGKDVDGRAWVEVRDALTGSLVRDVWFSSGYSPIALAVLPDMNGNGISEVAVLLVKDSDNRAWVHIKDAATLAVVSTVWFQSGYTPLDLEFVPNVDGNAGPELAVLMTRNSDRRTWVHVKDAQTGAPVKDNWFLADYTPKDLAVIDNLDGNPGSELAVLFTRDSDSRTWVHIKDTLTGAYVKNVWFDTGFTPTRLEIVPDLDTNVGDELAVLTTKDLDARAWVLVKDASSGAFIRNVWFQGAFAPKYLAVLPDMDANPGSELAVLGETTGGQMQVEIKDAKTNAFINQVDFP